MRKVTFTLLSPHLINTVEKEALEVLQRLMKYNIHKIGRVIVTSNEVGQASVFTFDPTPDLFLATASKILATKRYRKRRETRLS